jgi:hypothetical protein
MCSRPLARGAEHFNIYLFSRMFARCFCEALIGECICFMKIAHCKILGRKKNLRQIPEIPPIFWKYLKYPFGTLPSKVIPLLKIMQDLVYLNLVRVSPKRDNLLLFFLGAQNPRKTSLALLHRRYFTPAISLSLSYCRYLTATTSLPLPHYCYPIICFPLYIYSLRFCFRLLIAYYQVDCSCIKSIINDIVISEAC